MSKLIFRSSGGFTLFEILIALVLLSAVGVFAMNSFNNSTLITTGKQNTASNLARQNLEDLKNAVGDLWWNAGGQRLSPVGPSPQPAATVLDGITFTPTYTVTNVDIDLDGTADVRRVTTNVCWPGAVACP